MLKIAGFAAALVAATSIVVAPAQAGTGASHYCFDGGWTDLPLVSTPITFGVEIETTPTTTAVVVCYAASEVGYSGAHVTGGFVKVLLHPNGSGEIQCQSDQNPAIVDLDCTAPITFTPTAGGLKVTYYGTVTGLTTVVVGPTGFEIYPFITLSPGITVNPLYPCLYVNGGQVLPNCGNEMIP